MGIAFITQPNYPITPPTPGRFILGRVTQLVKVIFIGAVVDIHFRFKHLPALLTILPAALMAFGMVATAQGIAAMVAAAAIVGKGKHLILVFIVADPVVAAFGFGQVLGFAAQTTTGNFAALAPGALAPIQLLDLTQGSLGHSLITSSLPILPEFPGVRRSRRLR